MEDSSLEQIEDFYRMCYDDNQVNKILLDNNLNQQDFGQWITGQTGLVIFKDGKSIFGYFKSDVNTYIKYKVKGQQAPIWD